jgi:hypothetical protein
LMENGGWDGSDCSSSSSGSDSCCSWHSRSRSRDFSMKESKFSTLSAAVSFRKVERTENSSTDIADVCVWILKHSAFGIPETVLWFQVNIEDVMGVNRFMISNESIDDKLGPWLENIHFTS